MTMTLEEVFYEELQETKDALEELTRLFPRLIGLASNNALKQVLSDHLDELETQIVRIEQVFVACDIYQQVQSSVIVRLMVKETIGVVEANTATGR